jgi:hypothetical protein
MSNLSPVRQRFHAAQRQQYERLPGLKPELTKDSWLAALNKVRDNYLKEYDSGPAETRDAIIAELDSQRAHVSGLCQQEFEMHALDHFRDRYRRLLNLVIESVGENERQHKDSVFIGTFPTYDVNARLIPPSKTYPDDRFIVIDTGIPVLLNLVAKILANIFVLRPVQVSFSTFEKISFSDVRAEIMKHPEAVKRYGDILCSYVVSGSPMHAGRYVVNHTSGSLAAHFLECMEFFVIAHECGHVINGLRPSFMSKGAQESNLVELMNWKMGQLDEYLADEKAAEIFTKHFRNSAVGIYASWFAIFCMFYIFYDFQRMIFSLQAGDLEVGSKNFAKYYGGTGSQGSGYHPAPLERLEAIERYVAKIDVLDQFKIRHVAYLAKGIMTLLSEYTFHLTRIGIRDGRKPYEKWERVFRTQ